MNRAVLCWSVIGICATAFGGIQDLGFISGSWHGTQGASVIEEQWMGPEGDGILGMAREVSGGKTRLTELGLITEREGRVVLLLRHFGAGQVAREDKDAPLVFVLKDLAGRRAEFLEERTGVQLIYERTAEDRLTVTLIKIVNGKEVRSPFEYRKR